MAYTQDEKSTGLDVLTTLAGGDLHIVGDVSDSGRAKAITEDDLEINIANSSNFTDALIANTNFTTDLANDTNFTTTLGNNSNFISTLTNNATFQTSVNNFVTGGTGGGGGGVKLAIDTTEVSNATTTPVDAFTVSIPNTVLSTNNAIRFTITGETDGGSGSGDLEVSYGGQTLGTVSVSGTHDFVVNGFIMADNSDSLQKTQLQLILDGTSQTVINGNLTVDSTNIEDLIVSIVSSNTRQITVQSIIVERIDNNDDGIIISTTASEDITVGTPVGVSNGIDDSVARANTNSWDVTFPDTIINHKTIKVATDKVATLYRASSATLRVCVSSIDTSDFKNALAYGSYQTITTDLLVPSSYPLEATDIAYLDENKFIVTYAENSSNTIVKYVVGTVSGTTITLGTAANVVTASDPIDSLIVTAIGTDKGVISYRETSTILSSKAFTTSGTVATFGSAVTYSTSSSTASIAATKINTDKFILVTGTAGGTEGQVGSISGTTITLGTLATITTSAGFPTKQSLSIVSHDTDKFICSVYVNPSQKVTASTVSGTTITVGTELVNTTTASNSQSLYVVSPTEIYFTATFPALNGAIGKISVSGTTLTLSGIVASRIVFGGNDVLTNMGSYFFMLGATGTIYFIYGMSLSFIGIAQSSASKGNSLLVKIAGVDKNQTGLNAGGLYKILSGELVQIGTHSLISSAMDTDIVTAISSTSIKI